jgi:hypothetical protein
MKRFAFIIMLGILLIAWGNSAYALKKVLKSGNDTTENKTAQGEQAKPNQPPANQPSQVSPRPNLPPPMAPKDDFIDKDGDGINDNLERIKLPEIKKDRIEPPPRREQPPVRIEPPPKHDPPKSPVQEPKRDETEKKKHSD